MVLLWFIQLLSKGRYMPAVMSYEVHVRSKFPLPSGYRELVHGEPLDRGTLLIDRGTDASVQFQEWGIYSEIMVIESGAITVRTNFCWFGIRNAESIDEA